MDPSTPFSGSAAVYDWISGFINMERNMNLRSFRLDRMKILADLARNPESCAPAIHLAGSKGKGSVTGMIAAILNQAGYKCGCYASPHVMDFRERLSLGKTFFNEDIYHKAGKELREIIETVISKDESKYALFNPETAAGIEPTFFELMTLWFFLCSRAAKVAVMAVETGMGGRLDATNILDPVASVITLIELEHTEYLGNTIGAIAKEKAGIIKPRRVVIAAKQNDDALEVFRQKALEVKSPFFYFPDWGEIDSVKIQKQGTSFSLKLKDPKDGSLHFYKDLFFPIPGEVQAENAGLALLAVKTAYPEIDESIAGKALADFSIPGRFQRVMSEPLLIIDGAHTYKSAENCVKTFTALYGDGGILTFGCAAGKDVAAMAGLFIRLFSRIIITAPGSFKKSSPEEIYNVFKQKTSEMGVYPELFFIPETEKALKTALELGRELSLPILGTGSFYLAAEFLKVYG